MPSNQVYRERVVVNNGPHKWWQHRRFKIIGISGITLIVFAVILALLLNFVVFAPKKSETSTTAATSLSSLTTTISTPPLSSTTTSQVTLTTTPPQTTVTTTTQQLEWSVTSNMSDARQEHTASVLSNGKVLVTGGFNHNIGFLNSAELYDPSTGIWTTTGSMTNARD
ncbi:unnamed protein product, partial [Adineta steineri]